MARLIARAAACAFLGVVFLSLSDAPAQISVPSPATTYLTAWHVPLRPNDLAANPETGTLAVIDAGSSSIEVLRPGGGLMTSLPGFRDPRSAAFLPGSVLLVGEAGSGSVKGYDMNGRVVLTLGKPNGEFSTPNDIAVHLGAGRVFVVDSAENVVKAYRSSDGVFELSIGSPGTGPGELRFPISAAVSPALNELYVGDARNRRIEVFDADTGAFKRTLGGAGSDDGEFSFIGGLFVDGLDRLYAVESLGGFVQVLEPGGAFIRTIGEHGNGPGQLRSPKAVVVDRYNRLLVSSFFDSRIELWGIDSYQNPSDSDLEATARAIPDHIHPNLPDFQIVFQISGVDPVAIEQDSLRINGAVGPKPDSYRMGPHLSARFDTGSVLATLPSGTAGAAVLTLSGATTDGRVFEASVEIVIVPPPEPDPVAEEATP